MRLVTAAAVTLLIVSETSAFARAVTTTCPVAEAVVSPEVSRQSTTATVGMIADRVSSVASGIGTAGAGEVTTMGVASCGRSDTLVEDTGASDGSSISLGQASAAETNQGTVAIEHAKPKAANGIWTSTSATWIKKTDPSGEFSGNVITVVAGFDRKVMADTILGLAVGTETAFINTHYNKGTIRGRSFSLAPYVGYALTDWLTLDATVGHAWVYYNYTDESATTEVYSDAHASRWFGSTDLTAKEHFDSLILSASAGYMRVSETEKSFLAGTTPVASSAVNVGQLRTQFGVGYDFVTSWAKLTPSVFVRLQYEVPHQGASTLATNYVTSTDTTSAVFGVSLDAVIDQVWTLNVVGYTEEFRQNTSARTLGLNARYVF